MRGIPEFRCDEELFTLHDGRDDLLQRRTDLVLVLVHHGQVEMAVPISHCDLDLSESTTIYQHQHRTFCKPNIISFPDYFYLSEETATYSILDLLGLRHPRPKSDLGDCGPIGESDDISERHNCCTIK